MIDIGISFKEACILYRITEFNSIEQKLYLVSLVLENKGRSDFSFQINKEITIFKDIRFSILKFSNSETHIQISDIIYKLSTNRRIITFIDDKQSVKRYVYNFNHFKDILKEKKFKLFNFMTKINLLIQKILLLLNMMKQKY